MLPEELQKGSTPCPDQEPEKQKTIYDLKLHERIIVNSEFRAMRVHDGWIYERIITIDGAVQNIGMIFVPYNEPLILNTGGEILDFPEKNKSSVFFVPPHPTMP